MHYEETHLNEDRRAKVGKKLSKIFSNPEYQVFG